MNRTNSPRMTQQMTSAELAEARKHPYYCQTVVRPSRVHKGEWVYSDLEQTSPEALALSVSQLLADGWQLSRPAFIRYPPGSKKNPRNKVGVQHQNPKVRSLEEQAVLIREGLHRQDEAYGQHVMRTSRYPKTAEDAATDSAEYTRLHKAAHATRLRLAAINQQLGRGMAETSDAWRKVKAHKNPAPGRDGPTIARAGTSVSGGPLWHVKQGGRVIGTINYAKWIGQYMVQQGGAAFTAHDTLKEAAATLGAKVRAEPVVENPARGRAINKSSPKRRRNPAHEIETVKQLRKLPSPITITDRGNENLYFTDGTGSPYYAKYIIDDDDRAHPARDLTGHELSRFRALARPNPSAAHAAPSVNAALLDKISDLTEHNDHTGALLVLARQVLKSPTFTKKTAAIQSAQNRAGYLTEALQTKRAALSARMFAQAKRRLGYGDYVLLRSSF